MARGIKKHLKRMNAPSHWMLDKLRGQYAPKPNAGPHKLRECLPLIVLLRNRLKYALNYREVRMIVMQRLVNVDGKVRCDMNYPAGFMDVVSLDKTKEHFRLLYDTKGRFVCHKIHRDEATYKLCKIKAIKMTGKAIPVCVTHDGRTIRFPPPALKLHDSVRFNLKTGKIDEIIPFATGNVCMINGGNNIGRVGTIVHRERHPGSFEIVHLKDTTGHAFATRLQNVFPIGIGSKEMISLPKGMGIKLSNIEDRRKRMGVVSAPVTTMEVEEPKAEA